MTFEEIRNAVNAAWRDYVVNGVPATGQNEPVKQEIRAALLKLTVAMENGGFSAPPNWAADLAEVQSKLEDVDAVVATAVAARDDAVAIYGSIEAVQDAAAIATDAVQQIQEVADGAPDAPSILNKVSKDQNGADFADADKVRENVRAFTREIVPSAAIWNPPPQRPARADKPNWFADGYGWKYADFLTNLWEPLRAAYPSWISRTQVGTDQSGTYPIYKYVFEPEGGYDRTVVVGCSIHGSEVLNSLAAYLFFKAVAERWAVDPQLGAARHRVRWVVIPCVNPWGQSQTTKTRYNSRGVDLNRNFDWRWPKFTTGSAAFGQDYKGTAVFSEAESRAYRDVVLSYPDAVAAVDLHDYGGHVGGFKYPIYLPAPANANDKLGIERLLGEVRRPGETGMAFGLNDLPNAFNYFASLGLSSSNPEWGNAAYAASGGQFFDATDMTEALRWFGNVLLHYASAPSTRQAKPSPWAKFYSMAAPLTLPIETDPTVYTALAAEETYTIPCAGILRLSGFVVAEGALSVATTLRVKHHLGMDGSRENVTTSGGQMIVESMTGIPSGSVRVTLPFDHVIPVAPGDGLVARMQPRANGVGGQVYIYRYSAVLEFIPTDSNAVEWRTASALGGAWSVPASAQ